jgi:hypothetical protein
VCQVRLQISGRRRYEWNVPQMAHAFEQATPASAPETGDRLVFGSYRLAWLLNGSDGERVAL